MISLQSLRQAKHFTRWVLVWFMVSLGVAIASPLVQPTIYTEVCSATGSRWVATHDASQEGAALHTLDCVLCAPAVVPPPLPGSSFMPHHALHYLMVHAPAAHITWHASMLIAARGPPMLI